MILNQETKPSPINEKVEFKMKLSIWKVASLAFAVSVFLLSFIYYNSAFNDDALKDKPDIFPILGSNEVGPVIMANRGDLKGLQNLVKSGADINQIDVSKRTPLIVAIGMSHTEMAIWLIDSGADINFKDVDGDSALNWCAAKRNIEIARVLLDKGATCDSVDISFGQTPLITAVCLGDTAMVKLLKEHGANSEMRDSSGMTALDYAKKRNRSDLFEMLEKGSK